MLFRGVKNSFNKVPLQPCLKHSDTSGTDSYVDCIASQAKK